MLINISGISQHPAMNNTLFLNPQKIDYGERFRSWVLALQKILNESSLPLQFTILNDKEQTTGPGKLTNTDKN